MQHAVSMLYAVVRYQASRLAFLALLSIASAVFPFSGFAASSVTLAWDPPAFAANIASYNLYYGGTSGVYTNVVLAGTSTNATITALLPGTTYYFAATTVDTLGLESDFSNEATCSLPGIDQPPAISSIPAQVVAAGSKTAPLAFTIGDADSPIGSLTLTASSSNPKLVQNSGLALGGSNTNRTITVTPVKGQVGVAMITITVSDGIAFSSTSFQLAVQQKPTAPGHMRIVAQSN
jgi:hypothetical protein